MAPPYRRRDPIQLLFKELDSDCGREELSHGFSPLSEPLYEFVGHLEGQRLEVTAVTEDSPWVCYHEGACKTTSPKKSSIHADLIQFSARSSHTVITASPFLSHCRSIPSSSMPSAEVSSVSPLYSEHPDEPEDETFSHDGATKMYVTRPATPSTPPPSSDVGDSILRCLDGQDEDVRPHSNSAVLYTENIEEDDIMSEDEELSSDDDDSEGPKIELSEDTSLDSYDVIRERATAALHSTPEYSVTEQLQNSSTCALTIAGSRSKLSPIPESLKISPEEWKTVRWEYAQALFIFYGYRQHHTLGMEKICALQLHMCRTTSYSLDANICANFFALSGFFSHMTDHIWSAALRWASSWAMKNELPENEAMGNPHDRVGFWEEQLDDEAVKHILLILSPGLHINRLLKIWNWKALLYSIVVRIIDDLYCFKLGRSLYHDGEVLHGFVNDAFRQILNRALGIKVEDILVGGLLAECLLRQNEGC